MFSFSCIIFKHCFCFYERLFFVFSFRLIFHNFSKNVFSSLLLFLPGKNFVLLFIRESFVSFLFLNFSICLNFLSNSLRPFFSPPMLLLGVGQNLRPTLSKFIWSLFNLYVDKFIILGLMLVSFFILVFPSVSVI